MAQVPISTFQLFKTPFDPKYKNVTDFATKSERTSYFATLTKSRIFTDAQYVRRNATYNVPLSYDEVKNFNYIVYNNNEGLGDEYAFIREKRFLNFETTELTLQVDVWQSNLFNMVLKEAFTERRHVDRYNSTGIPLFEDFRLSEGGFEADITDGKHFMPQITDGNGKPLLWLVIIAQFNALFGEDARSHPLNDFSGFSQLYVPFDPSDTSRQFLFATGEDTGEFMNSLSDIIEHLEYPQMLGAYVTPYAPLDVVVQGETFYSNESGLSVWSCPFNTTTTDLWTLKCLGRTTPRSTPSQYVRTFPTENLSVSVEDLRNACLNKEPRSDIYEAKLHCFPYDFYQIHVGGSRVIVKNEDRNSPVAETLSCIVNPSVELGGVGCSLQISGTKLDPTAENTRLNNIGNASFGLKTDPFKSYMLNNSTQLVYNQALNVGQFAMGNPAKGVQGIAGGIPALLDLAIRPDTPNGTSFSASHSVATGDRGGLAYSVHYKLNPANKKVLFDEFTMHGYRVDRVETVKLRRRYYYDYIKTNGIHIEGVGNLDEQLLLESIFDNGVTVWHSNDARVLQYGDYRFENAERSLL